MGYGPLIKYGLIVLAFAAFCLGLIAYGEHRKQIEWDAAIAVQAVQAAENVIKAEENTASVVTRYIRVKGETQVITETVEKEVVKYVDSPHPACLLDREFERVWDDANRLSAAAGPAGGTAAGAADLEAATVLRAHAGDARAFADLRDRYAALVEWVKTTYAIQKEGAGR
jgi:hypothetical protein